MYYLYILKNNNSQIYVGVTKPPKNRLQRHNSNRGAKYTSDYKSFRLVYLEKYLVLDDAIQREKQIKRWTRAKKEALINQNYEKLKHLSKSTD